MGYQGCLEAAGAVVHDFEYFGDYQGTWLAYVTYGGKQGIVSGFYGSCSGCDAFEAEFSYAYDDDATELADRYALFGESYLGTETDSSLAPIDYYLDLFNKQADVWHDSETADIVLWLEGLKNTKT